jgi:hypothetical protein
MKIPVNVNYGASVILTEDGANVINKCIEEEAYFLTDEQRAHLFGKSHFEKGDTFNGMLWDLMRIFGKSFYHGCGALFLGNKITLDDSV